MFNWYGNHKIGIFGAQDSGKTMLLLSWLCHLENHNEKHFFLGDGVRVSDFSYRPHPERDFGFLNCRQVFWLQRRWPAPTADFTLAACRFRRSDCWCARDVEFVDIPGERSADSDIWLYDDYEDWSRETLNCFISDPERGECLREFLRLSALAETPLETLAAAYKRALAEMYRRYCAVSPSSFILDVSGKLISREELESPEKTAARPLSPAGDFVPLPPEWRGREVFSTCRRRYRQYRRETVLPLYAEINACDAFVVCVDVFRLLSCGPLALWKTRQETRCLLDKILPNRLQELFDKLGGNPPRLVFAATKADLVSGLNRERLQYLLDDFARPFRRAAIDSRNFLCSSCVSTLPGAEPDIPVGDLFGDGKHYKIFTGALPDEWPDPRQWRPGDYGFQPVPPVLSAGSPPRQINLDRIFNFLTEDI